MAKLVGEETIGRLVRPGRRYLTAVALIALDLLIGRTASAQIQIINVPAGNVAALKNAINTANTDNKDDIIILANNSTYTCTSADNATEGGNALPVIIADHGHSVSIAGHGSTIERSASTLFRIVELTSGAIVSISDVIFSTGSPAVDSGSGETRGGAIYNNAGALTLTSCTFSQNTVVGARGADGNASNNAGATGGPATGAAIYSNGSLTVGSCTFLLNGATGGTGGNGFSDGAGGAGGVADGGAVAAATGSTAYVSISNSEFNNNTAVGGAAGTPNGGSIIGGAASGGAIVAVAPSLLDHFIIIGCDFVGNKATAGTPSGGGFGPYVYSFGGAISGNGGAGCTLRESTLRGNQAFYGGGVAEAGVIERCTFQSNSAYGGGAGWTSAQCTFICFGTPSNSFSDCTFYTNSASGGGGALAGYYNSVTNCTFSANTAPAGAIGGMAGGTAANSIFKTGASGSNFDGMSSGHNISNDDGNGRLTASGDMPNTDPQLLTTTPQGNGGPTQTFALGPGSPAINHGDDSKAPPRDQRGNFRNGTSDIGAFEAAGSLVGKPTTGLSGSNLIVGAEVVYGHTYRLERRTDLGAAWQNVSGVNDFVATNNDVESFTDPNALSLGKAFYHVICIQ